MVIKISLVVLLVVVSFSCGCLHEEPGMCITTIVLGIQMMVWNPPILVFDLPQQD